MITLLKFIKISSCFQNEQNINTWEYNPFQSNQIYRSETRLVEEICIEIQEQDFTKIIILKLLKNSLGIFKRMYLLHSIKPEFLEFSINMIWPKLSINSNKNKFYNS